ncbi:hypothetical protein DXX96_00745 [Lactococcus petauri]|nr:hypothetical protein [Lactococcus petauri]
MSTEEIKKRKSASSKRTRFACYHLLNFFGTKEPQKHLIFDVTCQPRFLFSERIIRVVSLAITIRVRTTHSLSWKELVKDLSLMTILGFSLSFVKSF